MEITSGLLTPDQVSAELKAIAEILLKHGIEEVVACFGIGSATPMDQLWKPHELQVSQLSQFAQTAMDEGFFEPGVSDLFVDASNSSTKLRFCHESDIHLESTNPALVEAVARRWQGQRFSGFRKYGEDWVPFADGA